MVLARSGSGSGSLESKTFDPAKFPQMTAAMRAAMYDEARLFFESIVRENRSVVSFVDCDYTFLNGTLATLYGLDKKVTGPAMAQGEADGCRIAAGFWACPAFWR